MGAYVPLVPAVVVAVVDTARQRLMLTRLGITRHGYVPSSAWDDRNPRQASTNSCRTRPMTARHSDFLCDDTRDAATALQLPLCSPTLVNSQPGLVPHNQAWGQRKGRMLCRVQDYLRRCAVPAVVRSAWHCPSAPLTLHRFHSCYCQVKCRRKEHSQPVPAQTQPAHCRRQSATVFSGLKQSSCGSVGRL